MMTERLYYRDAYLTEFDAWVTDARPGGWVALDRSAFYPTSGGQPYDTGVLESGEGTVRVLDVTAEGDAVWHRTDGTLPLGCPVRGRVDWARRWDHMQQHAGDHMLAGAIWELWGGVTLGLHTGLEDSSIDVTMPDGRTRLAEDEIDRLETLVNARVQRDDPIRCWFPGEEELARLPLRKRPTVDRHVRVVAMGDYEMVPCGGTHPGSTGQIGPVKVLACAPAKGVMRLSFLAGMRAIRFFQEAARSARETAALLSCPLREAPGALTRERAAQAEQRRDMESRLLQAALLSLRAARQGAVYAAHLPFASADSLVRAAAEIIRQEANAVALLSCPRGEKRHLVFARGAAADADMAALLRACGARGGGKPDMAQGSAEDSAALRAAAEALGVSLPAEKIQQAETDLQ